MIRPRVLQVLFLSLMLVTVALPTESVFAGVHGGGGGGFHGGGGSFHGGGGYGGGWHGGSGGWHGGGYGWHGGYGGWHGGYYGGWRGGYYGGGWGYPGYWGGWGFGVSLNFGWPYWGYYGYPYAYGYSPYYYPYYPANPYYYSAPVSDPGGYANVAPYGQPYAQPYGQPYAQPNGNPQASAPVARPGVSAPQPAPNANGVNLIEATYRAPAGSQVNAQNRGVNPGHPASVIASAASHRPPSSGRQLSLRPEVQNVIRALNGMPPAAREREIDSGRYNTLTAQELELVRYAAGVE